MIPSNPGTARALLHRGRYAYYTRRYCNSTCTVTGPGPLPSVRLVAMRTRPSQLRDVPGTVIVVIVLASRRNIPLTSDTCHVPHVSLVPKLARLQGQSPTPSTPARSVFPECQTLHRDRARQSCDVTAPAVVVTVALSSQSATQETRQGTYRRARGPLCLSRVSASATSSSACQCEHTPV